MEKNALIDELFNLYREFYPSTADSDIDFMTQEIYRLEDAAKTARRGRKTINPQRVLEMESRQRTME